MSGMWAERPSTSNSGAINEKAQSHLTYGVPSGQMNERDQDRRMVPYARFPIGTTFPVLRGTKDTTAALARSSKAVAMYFA